MINSYTFTLALEVNAVSSPFISALLTAYDGAGSPVPGLFVHVEKLIEPKLMVERWILESGNIMVRADAFPLDALTDAVAARLNPLEVEILAGTIRERIVEFERDVHVSPDSGYAKTWFGVLR